MRQIFVIFLTLCIMATLTRADDITTTDATSQDAARTQARYVVNLGFLYGDSVSNSTAESGLYDYAKYRGNNTGWWVLNDGVANGSVADTYGDGGDPGSTTPPPDYFGYKFKTPVTVTNIDYTDYCYPDGGTFNGTPAVQYLVSLTGEWQTATVNWNTPFDSSFSSGRRNAYVITPSSIPDGIWGLRLYGDTSPSPAWDNNGWASVSELRVSGSAAFGHPVNFATNLATAGQPVCTSNAWQSGSGSEITDGNFNNDAKVWLAAEGNRYVGLTWTGAQERVAGLGVTMTFYSDGGWFLDETTNALQVEYSADGTNWSPVTGLQKGRYTADYPTAAELSWDYRGSWLFTFDTLLSIKGLRLIGQPAGSVVALGNHGYVSIREFQVFASAADWDHALVVASDHGSAVPWIGTNFLPYFAHVDCSVDSQIELETTQYVCTGWAGEGSVPSGGTSNSVSFAITNDSTILWLWQTNYRLEAVPGPNGGVDPTNQWVKHGSNITVTAQAAEYYHFTNWTGDVAAGQYENPIALLMDAPKSITAHFAPTLTTNTGTPHWWLAQYSLTNGGLTFEEAALTNRDADDFSNWQEYIADTDPTNRASCLALTSISIDGSGMMIGWKGGVQATQALEWRQDLTATAELWQAIMTNVPPTATVTNWIDPSATNMMRFYRVRAWR